MVHGRNIFFLGFFFTIFRIESFRYQFIGFDSFCQIYPLIYGKIQIPFEEFYHHALSSVRKVSLVAIRICGDMLSVLVLDIMSFVNDSATEYH